MNGVSRRQRHRRQLRADMLWVAAFFVALQIGLAIMIDRGLPKVRDAHWAALENRLRCRLEENPQAKLVVMLGSSRTQLALQGGRVSDRTGNQHSIVFNLGINGSGPLMEFVALRRLLEQGIRPDAVLVELMPSFLSQKAGR